MCQETTRKCPGDGSRRLHACVGLLSLLLMVPRKPAVWTLATWRDTQIWWIQRTFPWILSLLQMVEKCE